MDMKTKHSIIVNINKYVLFTNLLLKTFYCRLFVIFEQTFDFFDNNYYPDSFNNIIILMI